MRIDDVLKQSKCTGCFSCFLNCPKKAIKIVQADGELLPYIDESLCINCGICAKKCHVLNYNPKNESFEKVAFVGKDKEDTLQSKTASGGIASSIARSFLNDNGIVYGASIYSEDDNVICSHKRISTIKELELIQGSKYTRSDCREAFVLAKKDLIDGKRVLFTGTSCQIAALKLFVGEELSKELFTIDLVCHGVPKEKVFSDYISFLEKKYKSKIFDISFRKKNDLPIKHNSNYVFSFSYFKKNHLCRREIKLRNSSFYRLFMARGGYREGCYNCLYANTNKPSDITLGDCYSKNNYFDERENVSFILIHTNKGFNMLKNSNAITHETNLKNSIDSHEQLIHPSKKNSYGTKLYHIYRAKGFLSLERYISFKNKLHFIPALFRKIFSRNN